MNKLLLISFLLFVAVTGNAENAPLKSAELVNFNLDKEQFGQKYINNGSVEINSNSKTITLKLLELLPVCPTAQPGFASCRAVGFKKKQIKIEIPIIDVSTTDCGATVYRAARDLRTIDGNLQELTIVDNSTMNCQVLLPEDAMTDVVYSVTTSGFGGTVKNFNSTTSGTLLMVNENLSSSIN